VAAMKWFDLSRFGAKLRVLPDSPLRGTSLTCLDIYDSQKFTSGWNWDHTEAHRQSLQDAWSEACQRLGFGGKGIVVYEDLPSGEKQRMTRFVSSRLQFNLKDIQALVPGVELDDLVMMDVDEIALRAAPAPEMPQAWQQFVQTVLAREAEGVWTPKVNPFARPWSEAQTFAEFRHSKAEGSGNPLITRRGLGGSSQLRHALDEASYRTNALVPFYVDEATALADGWRPDEIEQVDLPFALPLWVTDKGQVQALQDVRFVPELMDADPIHYLGAVKNGVVAGALREAQGIGRLVRERMEQWARWAANPATLDAPDSLWGTITEVAGAHADLCEKYPTVITSGLDELSDGKQAERRGQFRAKPLVELDRSAMFWLARLCARYAALSDEEMGVLHAALEAVLSRGHELMAEHLQAMAAQELAQATKVVQQSPERASASRSGVDAEGKPRHEDAGEKIGGARKDFAKRAMVAEDLEPMNDAERDLYVLKKNIWPSLDYSAMRASGVEAEAALGIKIVKDKLWTTPSARQRSVEDDALYIKAIAMVRDRMAGVKTLSEFNAACKDLFEIGCSEEHEKRDGVRVTDAGRITIFGTRLQRQWGSTVCDIFFDARSGRTPVAVGREIRRKIEIWNREPTEDEKWRSMVKAKVEKTQEKKDEERAKAEMDRELHRPHLARVERVGEDWRGGRDIVADDLLEHFGFRGVEFGNWLPQGERQQVLNMAFDSLCDLAAALKLPPKGLSLDGSLAVAFGSRGSGGKNAALAHYEPSRKVINLTRMNGAGSLAHEWWHALDDHLGNGAGFLSERVSGRNPVMGNLVGRMRRRLARPDEILDLTERNARQGLDNARSWLFGQPQEVRHQLFDVMNAEYARIEAALYDEARSRITVVQASPDYAKQGFDDDGAVDFAKSLSLADEVFETIRKHCPAKPALRKAKEKIEGNLRYMVANLGKAVTVKAARDLGVPLPELFRGRRNCLPSDFVQEAEKLDQTRSSPYWATTVELFARAGAAYVIDKIDEVGGRSDYLVYGADEYRYAGNEVGNPNPTGEDRKALAACFDALIADYRLVCLKEADQEALVEP